MREYQCINDNWIFEKQGMNSEIISLPHTWNAIDGQDGGNDYYRGTCVYKKTLNKPYINAGDQVYLEFRGVNSLAEVKVNDMICGKHEGGYSTFRVNITEVLEEVNHIEVAVDNAPNKKVYPQKADFTFYGGIYRDVYLITVPSIHFDLDYYGASGIMVSAEVQGEEALVQIKTYISEECSADKSSDEKGSEEKDSDIKNNAFKKVKLTIEGVASTEISISDRKAQTSITISNVHLWNGLEDPYLYEVTAELIVGDDIVDVISTIFGCRMYSFHKENGFILNGNPYPLHGVSRHQDRRDVGNALTKEMHKEDMGIILDMGANSIRLAHYQHDQYFYDLCDKMGVIVWAEIPYISGHLPEGKENTVSQMRELVLQNYNHPSIICWGLSNEITVTGIPDELMDNHKVLNELIHKLDPTRVTTMANISTLETNHPLIDIPDIMSFNLYYGWYSGTLEDNDRFFDKFHKNYPEKIIGLSEYGADTYYKLQTSKPERGDYTQQYQCIYHEHMLEMIHTRPYIWSTYVWNMFDFAADAREEAGDNGINHKGLVTFDRKVKKDAYFLYKAWWSKVPFIHVCGREYVDRIEDVTEVKVYSNLNKVVLYKDGELLEEQKGTHVFIFKVPITHKHKIEAKNGEYISDIEIHKVDELNPEYVLKKAFIHNWFEENGMEIIPGYFSVQDTMGEIKAVPEGKALLDAMMEHAARKRGDTPQNIQQKEAMDRMINRFTVLQLMKQAEGTITSEMLIQLNRRLSKIKKYD